jgi:hypothetical protein
MTVTSFLSTNAHFRPCQALLLAVVGIQFADMIAGIVQARY